MIKFLEVHSRFGSKCRILIKVDDIKAVIEQGDVGKYQHNTYIIYGDDEECTAVVSESYDEIRKVLEDV